MFAAARNSVSISLQTASYTSCGASRTSCANFMLVTPSRLCMDSMSGGFGEKVGEFFGEAVQKGKKIKNAVIDGTEDSIEDGAKGYSKGAEKAKTRERLLREETDFQISLERQKADMIKKAAALSGLPEDQIKKAEYVPAKGGTEIASTRKARIHTMREVIAHEDEIKHLEVVYVGAATGEIVNYESLPPAWFSNLRKQLRDIYDGTDPARAVRFDIRPSSVAKVLGRYRSTIEGYINSNDPKDFIRQHRDVFTAYDGLFNIATAYENAKNYQREIFSKEATSAPGEDLGPTREFFYLDLQPKALANYRTAGIMLRRDMALSTPDEIEPIREKIQEDPLGQLETYARSKGWKGFKIWSGKGYDEKDIAPHVKSLMHGLDQMNDEINKMEPENRAKYINAKKNLRVALNPKGFFDTAKGVPSDVAKIILPAEAFGTTLHNNKQVGVHYLIGLDKPKGDTISIDYDNMITDVASTDAHAALKEGLDAYIAYQEKGGEKSDEIEQKREKLGDMIRNYINNWETLFTPDDANIAGWETLSRITDSQKKFAHELEVDPNWDKMKEKLMGDSVRASFVKKLEHYIAMQKKAVAMLPFHSEDGYTDGGGYTVAKLEKMLADAKTDSYPRFRDIDYVVKFEKYFKNSLDGKNPEDPEKKTWSLGGGGGTSPEVKEVVTREEAGKALALISNETGVTIGMLMPAAGGKIYKYDYADIVKPENLAHIRLALSGLDADTKVKVNQIGLILGEKSDILHGELGKNRFMDMEGLVETMPKEGKDPAVMRIAIDYTDDADVIIRKMVKAVAEYNKVDPTKFIEGDERRLAARFHIDIIIDRDEKNVKRVREHWEKVDETFNKMPEKVKEWFVKKEKDGQKITLYIYDSGWGSPVTFEGRIGNNQIRIDTDESVSSMQEEILDAMEEQKTHDDSILKKIWDTAKVWNWFQG